MFIMLPGRNPWKRNCLGMVICQPSCFSSPQHVRWTPTSFNIPKHVSSSSQSPQRTAQMLGHGGTRGLGPSTERGGTGRSASRHVETRAGTVGHRNPRTSLVHLILAFCYYLLFSKKAFNDDSCPLREGSSLCIRSIR